MKYKYLFIFVLYVSLIVSGISATNYFYKTHLVETTYYSFGPVEPYRESLIKAGRDNKLDPELIAAVAIQESCIDNAYNYKTKQWDCIKIYPYQTGSVGERGILQIHPDHFVGRNPDWFWNPDYNIQFGSAYLKQMINLRNGNIYLGVSAYNTGPGNYNISVKYANNVYRIYSELRAKRQVKVSIKII